jgi:hypothetical protein
MFDWFSLIKYLLEGLAVAVATYFIPKRKIEYTDIIIIGLTAAAVFAVLDQFSPLVAVGARHGSGFAIGYQQVGFGDPSNLTPESESDEKNICQRNSDGTCTYLESALPEDKNQYLCKEKNGQCVAEPTESSEIEGFDGFK